MATHLIAADIENAREELQKYLPPTPLVFNPWLSEAYGCEVFLKLENMQPIGSFKIRGALYKICGLTPEEKKRGVIAASVGNHAQGVAWAARQIGVDAQIVMPLGAALVKIHNTKSLGAEVILKGSCYDEAYDYAKELAQKTRRVFVHAFRDTAVMAGQGTVALEILEQLPDIDWIIGSVGGGGMMVGVGTVFKALSPKTRIVGCQASSAAAMLGAIRQKQTVRLKSADSFADGIALVRSNERMRQLLEPLIDDWLGADEDSIAAAVLALLEKGKILVEGAGAVPLACLDQIKKKTRGKRVVLIVSGGNIDVNVLSRIIDVGLIRAGRRVRVNVLMSDKPGSLARLTGLIAEQGANIIQAIHDRNEPSTRMDETEVALTLDTRGPEHSTNLIEALRKDVLRVELVQH